jgi:predicted ArsR family transcriptional regulator
MPRRLLKPRILSSLKHGPLTSRQLAIRLAVRQSSVQAKMRQLEKEGAIARKALDGSQIIWVICPERSSMQRPLH